MLDITYTLRKRPNFANIPFLQIKNDILGRDYELSLLFCANKLIEKLSLKYKKNKNHKNILSFPIDEKEGEIIINLRQVQKEAKNFNHSFKEHLLYLYIHGLLHLKGLKHGKLMEKQEELFLNKYKKITK